MGAKRTIAECWIWNEGRPRGPLAGMSVVGGRAEDICSYRAFLSLTQMYGPAVRCKRFVDLVVSGLASMYPVSSWSRFAPDHHGYQRACVLISGQASTGHRGHQCSHAPGRPILHLYLSSRRPRLETVDRVTSSLAPHIVQFLCSSQGPFLRPGPQNVDRVARRGGQGRPLRLACGGLQRCQAAP
jgi:hypothetical protein